jgi:hypothetical protein
MTEIFERGKYLAPAFCGHKAKAFHRQQKISAAEK